MKKTFLFLLILLVFHVGYSQSDSIQKSPEKGIWLEPISPTFPGGEEKMRSFIHLAKNYPDSAKARGIEGIVYVQFIVKKTGELSDFTVLRSPDSLLSTEAIRIMKLMPNFIPGTNHNGDSADVRMVLPVRFKVNHDSIFNVVEIMPEFDGAIEKLFEYLGKNIKISETYFKNGIKSKFYFEFVVEKDGSLSNLKMIRNYDEDFYKHILLVFNEMPKWTPGKQNGEAVRVKYILPMNINFR